MFAGPAPVLELNARNVTPGNTDDEEIFFVDETLVLYETSADEDGAPAATGADAEESSREVLASTGAARAAGAANGADAAKTGA